MPMNRIRIKTLQAVSLAAFFVLLCTALSAYGYEGQVVQTEYGEEAILYQDIDYCKTNGGLFLNLDLAAPAGNPEGQSNAVIVYIHGGGFKHGDKAGKRGSILEAAGKGYIGVSVNYRLTGTAGSNPYAVGARFPDPVRDVKCAIRWIRANRLVFGIDPDRIAVVGGSAGASLALFVGLSDGRSYTKGVRSADPRLNLKEISSKPNLIINWYGPTDFEQLYNGQVASAIRNQPDSPVHKKSIDSLVAVTAYLGGDLDSSTQEAYRQASPVHYLDENDPPVLTLHGTRDRAVPFSQALLLDEMFELLDIGHKHDFNENEFQGAGHGFAWAKLKRRANERTWAFIEEHF